MTGSCRSPVARPLPDDGMPVRHRPSPYSDALSTCTEAGVASRNPDRPLIHYFDRHAHMCGDVDRDDRCIGIAAAFVALGVGSTGERVAVYLQNVPQFVTGHRSPPGKQVACVVSINPMNKSRELDLLARRIRVQRSW